MSTGNLFAIGDVPQQKENEVWKVVST